MIEVTLIYGFQHSVILALIPWIQPHFRDQRSFQLRVRSAVCSGWLRRWDFHPQAFSYLFSAAILACFLQRLSSGSLQVRVTAGERSRDLRSLLRSEWVLRFWRRFDIWIHDLRIHASRVQRRKHRFRNT